MYDNAFQIKELHCTKSLKTCHQHMNHRSLAEENMYFIYISFLVKAAYSGNTGCPRRNVPDFGRVFLMLKYTDITQNTYIQS